MQASPSFWPLQYRISVAQEGVDVLTMDQLMSTHAILDAGPDQQGLGISHQLTLRRRSSSAES